MFRLLPRLGLIHRPTSLFNRSLSEQTINSRLETMTKENKIVLFMKGIPDQPKCGFSRAVCQILDIHNIPKSYITANDVLEDEEIRQGIKEYTSWPTIPQVFIEGEFVGGCDIMLDLHKSGELIDMLDKLGIKSALKED